MNAQTTKIISWIFLFLTLNAQQAVTSVFFSKLPCIPHKNSVWIYFQSCQVSLSLFSGTYFSPMKCCLAELKSSDKCTDFKNRSISSYWNQAVVIFRNAHLVLKAFKNACKGKSKMQKASMYFKIRWILNFFSFSVKIVSHFYFQEICHKNGKS